MPNPDLPNADFPNPDLPNPDLPNDLYEVPEFRAWARRVLRELVPKIERAAIVASILPEGKIDAKFAVELGVSIMLDKPIIAIVPPGVRIPEKLAKVVDQFVELAPNDTAETSRRLEAAIRWLQN
jgi:hypothetical protein